MIPFENSRMSQESSMHKWVREKWGDLPCEYLDAACRAMQRGEPDPEARITVIGITDGEITRTMTGRRGGMYEHIEKVWEADEPDDLTFEVEHHAGWEWVASEDELRTMMSSPPFNTLLKLMCEMTHDEAEDICPHVPSALVRLSGLVETLRIGYVARLIYLNQHDGELPGEEVDIDDSDLDAWADDFLSDLSL